MRFIILPTQSDTPLNPSEELPPELRLLLSPEVKKLSYSELELRKLPEHPGFPGWRCCLVRSQATMAALCFITSEASEELELRLRFTAVAPQEEEALDRLRAFNGYEVTAEMMSLAQEGAIFLHCLPAHRGEEVSAEVIEGPQSCVWEEAENRLHGQKALLAWLMAPGWSP